MREGFDIVTAKDGLDALQLIGERMPDVILLDIEMPRMDGFEFAKTIKADPQLAHIPIIMITSRTAEKHRNRAKELGVDVYLGKPYQEEELLRHLRETGRCISPDGRGRWRRRRAPNPRGSKRHRSWPSQGRISLINAGGGHDTMAQFATKDIRTLALVGHGAAGKTTLAEALLPKAGAIQATGSVERGTTDKRLRSARKGVAAFAARIGAASRDTGNARAHDRHARDSRISSDRPSARSTRSRPRRRRQRIRRHRDDHFAHDGMGGEAQTVPPHHHQQDRRREHRSRRTAERDPGRVRQGMPADQPAGRRRQAGRRLFFQSCGRRGFLVGGRRAPRAGRSGRRGRRGADVALPRAGRDRTRPIACTLRKGAARRASGAGVLRLGANRCGRRGTARHPRQARPQSRGRQPAAVHQGRRARARSSFIPNPIRASTCWRTCSRW